MDPVTVATVAAVARKLLKPREQGTAAMVTRDGMSESIRLPRRKRTHRSKGF